jgi:hypothetical protein
MPYLIRRNDHYHFRIRVPSDLAPLIGQREIHRSLGTADLKAARGLARLIASKADVAFSTLRYRRLVGSPSEELSTLAISLLNADLPKTREIGPSKAPTTKGTPLQKLIEGFVKDRQSRWEPKTLLMHSATLRLLVDVLGDIPASSISRADCRRFRDLLVRLPPNVSKRFKGMPLEEAARLGHPPMYAAVRNSATGAAPYWRCGRGKTRPVVRLVPLRIGQDVCRGSLRCRSPVRIFGWS